MGQPINSGGFTVSVQPSSSSFQQRSSGGGGGGGGGKGYSPISSPSMYGTGGMTMPITQAISFASPSIQSPITQANQFASSSMQPAITQANQFVNPTSSLMSQTSPAFPNTPSYAGKGYRSMGAPTAQGGDGLPVAVIR